MRKKIFPYLLSILFVTIATFIGEAAKGILEPTNISMLYLLIVVLSAVLWGMPSAILTSVISVLCFDFFLIPPYMTFTVSHVQYVFTLIGFLIVGIVISVLTSKVRDAVLQRQTEKLQNAILNSITHDLKTPLSVITGSLSSLLEGNSKLREEEKTILVKDSLSEAEGLNEIVNDLLEMSRIDSGALKISKKPCDLRDVIDSSAEKMRRRIKNKRIVTEISEEIQEIPLDFAYMMKVFNYLFDNASKYADGGEIKVKASVAGKNAVIEVSDSGSGVPERDLEKIFDKFYRSANEKRAKGTGLGLSICRGIIESHGGRIHAEMSGLGGLSVIISIPMEK